MKEFLKKIFKKKKKDVDPESVRLVKFSVCFDL